MTTTGQSEQSSSMAATALVNIADTRASTTDTQTHRHRHTDTYKHTLVTTTDNLHWQCTLWIKGLPLTVK